MHLPFWLTVALLSPVLVYQGRRTRRTTIRLPEAGGAPRGQYGSGEPERRILVLGESTAAGVGVQTHDQGLASQLAKRLYQRTGKSVAWHSYGVNGATLAELMTQLDLSELPAADLVLLSMGVNDTTGLTPRHRYRQQIVTLQRALADRFPGPLALLSVPPMDQFTALPTPLRQVMGWRARQLDGVYRELARTQPEAFVHLCYPAVTDPGLLAADGYHPGERGYQLMGETLAELLDS